MVEKLPRFASTSGNSCIAKMRKVSNRTAVDVNWQTEPSTDDMNEFNLWLRTQLENIAVFSSVQIEDLKARKIALDNFLFGGSQQ